MNTDKKQGSPTAARVPLDDSIVIERREVVAVIAPDRHGEHPMLRAAFMAASDNLADVLDSGTESVSLEFKYGGHLFKASAQEVK